MSEEIGRHLDSIRKMAKDNGIECEVVFEESFQPDKAIVELATGITPISWSWAATAGQGCSSCWWAA